MTLSIGAYIVALSIFLVAVAIVLTEWRLSLVLRRIHKSEAAEEQGFPFGRKATCLAILFLFSVICFPATTFSLKASFVIPWQFLWAAAVLFFVSGVLGLMSGAWFLVKPSQRAPSLIIAAIVAAVFSYFALSFVIVPHSERSVGRRAVGDQRHECAEAVMTEGAGFLALEAVAAES